MNHCSSQCSHMNHCRRAYSSIVKHIFQDGKNKPRSLTYISSNIDNQFFLAAPSLKRKSSSMRGRPSRNLIFGSQPSNSFAFVMSGFRCLGSSGVFSTLFISTPGLMSCKVKCIWKFSRRFKKQKQLLEKNTITAYEWRKTMAKTNWPPSLSLQVQAL